METLNASSGATRLAVDIGSTVIKLAFVDAQDQIIDQTFHARNFELGIAKQVDALLRARNVSVDHGQLMVCSSANGGLRVGIVCLTTLLSGSGLRNQALLAGANPVFVRCIDDDGKNQSPVDLLIVAGGIDGAGGEAMRSRLERFDPKGYRFGTLMYAGNGELAAAFVARFPSARVIANPLADALSGGHSSVFEAIRRAYLDDLIYKEGVSELRGNLSKGIRPTPEVANRGFQRAVLNASSIPILSPSLLLDIGGATTDLHYTIEIVRDDSASLPLRGTSVARYVFTDLGIVASRDSLLLQLRANPRLFEFLSVTMGADGEMAYRSLRESDYLPSAEVLSYGCLFLALDRFAQGRGPGLPVADLARLAQVILTGGAAQTLHSDTVSRVIRLFTREAGNNPQVMIDRRYQIWVDGITWQRDVPQ